MSENKDPRGQFVQGSFKTSKGCTLATYTWHPDCDPSQVKGSIFLLHGILGHARFEFLEPNAENLRTEYEGSVPAGFNNLGLVVYSYDQPGHGLSSGLRVYWDSMDELRDTAIEFCEATLADNSYGLGSKPHFVLGMSMGGTAAVQVAQVKPDLFSGFVLLSPAVHKPDEMFGPFARMLYAAKTVVNALAPKLRVLKLPLNPDPTIRDSFLKDPLCTNAPVRARVASEFLRVYDNIESEGSSIHFPAVFIIVGSTDPIVSPSGIKKFAGNMQSSDKSVKFCNNLGHEVFREPGREDARNAVYDWIKQRL